MTRHWRIFVFLREIIFDITNTKNVARLRQSIRILYLFRLIFKIDYIWLWQIIYQYPICLGLMDWYDELSSNWLRYQMYLTVSILFGVLILSMVTIVSIGRKADHLVVHKVLVKEDTLRTHQLFHCSRFSFCFGSQDRLSGSERVLYFPWVIADRTPIKLCIYRMISWFLELPYLLHVFTI